jgi:hypothetical protein
LNVDRAPQLKASVRRLNSMELVSFISTEAGFDLVLSFAVQDPDNAMDIESLILLRTPKFEFVLDDHERGVKVSFERYGDEEDYLEEVRFSHQDLTLEIKTREHKYELDLRKVDRKELSAMRKLLHKLNFDHRVTLHDV